MCYGKFQFEGNDAMRRPMMCLAACVVFSLVVELRGQVPKELAVEIKDAPWALHVIADTSRGADGAKLADVNGDGLMDITTGCNIESKQS